MKELQGTWNVISLEVDGQAMPGAGVGSTIVIKGDHFQSLGMGADYEGTVKIDASKKPHTIDMLFTNGPEKGNTNLGIFELKGDSWRLCMNMTGKARPKTLSTKGGSGIALETLTRGTAAKTPVAKEKASAALKLVPAPELEGEWQMIELVTSGLPLDKKWLQYGKRVASDNRVTVTMAGQVQLQAQFTVDRRKDPMTMDYLLASGKTQEGIYRLAGDTLTVNFAAPGKKRPSTLASKKGDGCISGIWKRV